MDNYLKLLNVQIPNVQRFKIRIKLVTVLVQLRSYKLIKVHMLIRE